MSAASSSATTTTQPSATTTTQPSAPTTTPPSAPTTTPPSATTEIHYSALAITPISAPTSIPPSSPDVRKKYIDALIEANEKYLEGIYKCREINKAEIEEEAKVYHLLREEQREDMVKMEKKISELKEAHKKKYSKFYNIELRLKSHRQYQCMMLGRQREMVQRLNFLKKERANLGSK